MEPIEIIAQIAGLFGMAFNVFSYQQKKQRNLIICQLFGASFFFINFLLLGIAEGVLLIGAVMNLMGIVKSIVFLNKEKLRVDKRIWKQIWLVGFIASYVVSYVLAFTVFGTVWNLRNAVLELLPVIGMTAGTVAYFKTEAKATRKLGFIISPSWLVYDIFNLSIGGIITEALSLVSIVVGIVRHDIKKKEN